MSNTQTAASGAGGAPALAAVATPDFGNAGTITSRTDLPGAIVHVGLGEYLTYTLNVSDPAPAFAFTCKHKKWLTAADFGGPQSTYNWTHFQNAGDEDSADDVYTVALSFLGAPQTYTLSVARCDKTGAVLQQLKDLDFSSSDSTDFTFSSLRVFAL